MTPLPLLLLAQADQPADAGQVGWIVGLGAAATVVGALVGLGTLGRWLLRALDRRITLQTAGLKRVERAVATSNGATAGELLETTHATVEHLRGLADANRVRIDALDARLDRHIITGHRE